jgi:transposase
MSTVGHYPTDVSDAQWEVLQLLLPGSVLDVEMD